MPAILTHALFGRELAKRSLLDSVPTDSNEQRSAFLLGCQGPDPCFFNITGFRAGATHTFGSTMHKRKVIPAFEDLRASILLLPPGDRPIGSSFIAGLVAHFMLDREAHPFIYAQEDELCNTSSNLADAHPEVHALIESDIDNGIVARYTEPGERCQQPVTALEASDRVLRAAGLLMAHCARSVFGIQLAPVDYPHGVQGMRMCYRAIEPAGSRLNRLLAHLERTVRPHSILASLSHQTHLNPTNPAMNSEHHAWHNPFTGAEMHASFTDLFETALNSCARVLGPYLAGAPCDSLLGRINYEGAPLNAAGEPTAEGAR